MCLKEPASSLFFTTLKLIPAGAADWNYFSPVPSGLSVKMWKHNNLLYWTPRFKCIYWLMVKGGMFYSCKPIFYAQNSKIPYFLHKNTPFFRLNIYIFLTFQWGEKWVCLKMIAFCFSQLVRTGVVIMFIQIKTDSCFPGPFQVPDRSMSGRWLLLKHWAKQQFSSPSSSGRSRTEASKPDVSL